MPFPAVDTPAAAIAGFADQRGGTATRVIATSTIEQSIGAAVDALAAAVIPAITDATALYRTVRGLADGKDYGRYFAGEDPLVSYGAAATSVGAMLMRGNLLRQAVYTALATAETDASADLAAFPGAVAAVMEALRLACADPNDALRILAGLAAFSITTPFDGQSSLVSPAAALAAAIYFRAGIAVSGNPLMSWPNFLADPVGIQIARLTAATAMLIRRCAAISLARAARDYTPTSYQDAVRVRDLVDGALDAVILEAGDNFDDTSYAALSALRVAVIEDLAARGATKAVVLTRHFGAVMPSLAMAWRLYQDANRAGDILARNDVPHPAFLAVDLELLAA
jgi:hypothetical protein